MGCGDDDARLNDNRQINHFIILSRVQTQGTIEPCPMLHISAIVVLRNPLCRTIQEAIRRPDQVMDCSSNSDTTTKDSGQGQCLLMKHSAAVTAMDIWQTRIC